MWRYCTRNKFCDKVLFFKILTLRELSNCLKFNYQVSDIYGAKYGFKGLSD